MKITRLNKQAVVNSILSMAEANPVIGFDDIITPYAVVDELIQNEGDQEGLENIVFGESDMETYNRENISRHTQIWRICRGICLLYKLICRPINKLKCSKQAIYEALRGYDVTTMQLNILETFLTDPDNRFTWFVAVLYNVCYILCVIY